MTLAGTGIVGVAAIGGGSMMFGGTARATMQVETEDLEVTTEDGTVEAINLIVTEAEAAYENIEGGVNHFVFTTSVNGEELLRHSFPTQYLDESAGHDLGENSGTVQYHSGIDRPGGPGIPLFRTSSYEPSDFDVPEDGRSETFTLDVEVEFEVHPESGPENPAVTVTGSTSVDLTIHNEEGSSDGDGGGNEGGGGADPEPEASISGTKVSLSVELPNGESVTQ